MVIEASYFAREWIIRIVQFKSQFFVRLLEEKVVVAKPVESSFFRGERGTFPALLITAKSIYF